MSLSSSVDRAVKAYIDHTNVILSGDASLASLDVSMLQQPFNDLAAPQLAQLALAYQQSESNGAPVAEVDGKKKRNYKPRDPNAPKRPLTAYFRYLQEQRGPAAEEMAKSANGPGKPGDISKAVTERWKAMSEEEHAPYKEAYQRALATYKSTAEAETEGQANGAAEKAEDSDSESESSTDDEEESDAKTVMPPPPPKVASPEVKKTPKSAMKKKKDAKAAEDVPATPQFSSINPSVPIPSSQRKSSSPELKRKASADAGEDGAKKKRGRKTNKQKEAEAAEAAEIASTPVVPASDVGSDKPKKDKKKKRKSEAAA
jgi:hypothetical protein